MTNLIDFLEKTKGLGTEPARSRSNNSPQHQTEWQENKNVYKNSNGTEEY